MHINGTCISLDTVKDMSVYQCDSSIHSAYRVNYISKTTTICHSDGMGTFAQSE